LSLLLCTSVYGQQAPAFNGVDMNLGNLSRLSDAKTRSISPENFTGARGKGGMADPSLDSGKRNVANAWYQAKDLGKGWKVNPFIEIKSNETITIAEIEGPGAIQHIWMTPTGNWRFSILRFYWDDEAEPSVEVPVGDFFGMAFNEYAQLNSLAVTVNPGSAFNCYWKMPFRKKCKVNYGEPESGGIHASLLPGRLYTDRNRAGRSLFSCAIPQVQSNNRIHTHTGR
jgi:hypothetical protein